MRSYEKILATVAAQPWAILPEKGAVIADFLTRRVVNGEAIPEAEVRAAADRKRDGKGKAKNGTVGIIPVFGTITQRADWLSDWSGGTSAEEVGMWVDAFADDPDVTTIVLELDSPGGSVYGVEELALKIHAAAKRKKVVASVNSLAASAAYWVASQASEVVVTPGGEVGSIGVYVMHRDKSAAMERAGEKVTFVSAGELKTAGHPYGPLDDVSRAELQSGVNDYYTKFVKAVARGRRVGESVVRSGFGRGGVVRAEEAVREGMADRVGTLDSILAPWGLTAAALRRAEAERPAPTAATGGLVYDRTAANREAANPTPPPARPVDYDVETRRRKLRLAMANSPVYRQGATHVPPTPTPPAKPTAAQLAGVADGWPTDGRDAAADRVTCLHEAGHCVATLALGGTVVFATSNPEPDGRGGWLSAGSMQDRGLTGVDRLAMLAAGVVADGVTHLGGTDLEFANKIDPGYALRPKAFERARGIISANRPAVERLATALATKRVMSGDEVAAVVGTVYLPHAAS